MIQSHVSYDHRWARKLGYGCANRLIGFIFQKFYLLNYITVIENVLLPTLYADDYSDTSRERVLEMLDVVGLSDRVHFKTKHLSGGEQQRVSIARALINDPELILCDEPTGQLDSETAKGIMGILKRLNQEGKTILLITHDRDIAGYANQILHIKDGKFI